MRAKVTKSKSTDVGTTGHQWDGIEELNHPLPRWWLWTFLITIAWAIGYTVVYPAWPLLHSATPGLLGSSTRADVEADIKQFNDANAPMRARLVGADLASIEADAELKQFATSAGAAVFRTNCATCHGAGAAGVVGKGYPNLLDDDWLWGGDLDTIHTTITHGIRNTTDPEARYSEMPRFGADGLLEQAQIDQVVQHVLKLSGQEFDAGLASAGAQVFADNCAACHGAEGKGDRAQGAPNLTDAIWLYGGDVKALTNTVQNAHFGVMPAWGQRLSEADVRAVAVYVHGLGGGE